MRTLLIALALVATPAFAQALDYGDYGLLYMDAPFRSPAQSAGISLLTSIDAVGGYPDGTFRPNRVLNRAEFLKIVLASHPDIRVSQSDAYSCFPDVRREDWFSRYVCLAKKRDIVEGYPDGMFYPAQPVNYAEALKILSELYGHTAYAPPDAPWYAVYVQAAKNRGTQLPISLELDAALTRGQMARLAAAYRAEHEGELDLYRMREAGETIIVEEDEEEPPAEEAGSGSSSSSADSSASSTGGTVTQEPSNIVATGEIDIVYPARTSFARVGHVTQSIADGRFSPRSGGVYVRIARIELKREARSIEHLILIDQSGKEWGQFRIDTNDPDNEKWVLRLDKEEAPILPGGQSSILAVKARVRGINSGGFSEEMIQAEHFSIFAQNVVGEHSYEIVASDPTFPAHQTTMGLIGEVENLSGTSGVISFFDDVLIGSFGFTGSTVSAAPLEVEHITFTLDASYGVGIEHPYLKTTTTATEHQCTMSSFYEISCLDIPASMGQIDGATRVLTLHADIRLGGTGSGRTLQVLLDRTGSLNSFGAVRWSDGAGHYNWLPVDAPVATGTLWLIEE